MRENISIKVSRDHISVSILGVRHGRKRERESNDGR